MVNKLALAFGIMVCVYLIILAIRNIINDIMHYKTQKRITDLAQIAVCCYYLLNSDDGRQLIRNVMKEAHKIIDGKEEK